MRRLSALPLLVLLAAMACGGPQAAPARQAVPVADSVPAADPAPGPVPDPDPAPAPDPVPDPAPAGPALAAVTPTTEPLQAPLVVTAGMTHILAVVPTRAGASYQWTLSGGSIPGVTRNAAAFVTAGAAGTLALRCQVTVAGVVTIHAKDIPVMAPQPLVASFYGSGLSADSLANTQVGGPALNRVSYRFQAGQSGLLEAIRVFFIWSSTKPGYQAGLGGSIQVALLADDATPAHLPTGPALAALNYDNVLGRNLFYPKLRFPEPANLQAGALYHLVFSNSDPAPAENYVSLDTLYSNAQLAPMQPTRADAHWAVLVRSGAGAWKLRPGFTPTLELSYGGGFSEGNGYMEVWSSNPKTISGPAAVRQSFQVSGPSRPFTQVSVRLQRLAGNSPLTLRVVQADGKLLAQGSVPAAQVLVATSHWATVSFPASLTLVSGVAYHLELNSPADTQYSAFPLRKGLDKGFGAATCFPDGYAQFTTAGSSGWTGWDQWGAENLRNSDLQFLFVP